MLKSIAKISLILMLFLQCSSSGENMKKHSKFDPFCIYEEEIVDAKHNNLHSFISRARPAWMRGSKFHSMMYSTTSYPAVYVNGVRFGDLSSLKRLSLIQTFKIEYIRPEDASSKYGKDNKGGLILVHKYK